MKNILEYDVKILLALSEAITGNKRLFNWLLKNDYPELAALSNSINSDREAFT
jgi:hypothetical protein